MDVSIIIVNYNTLMQTKSCIDSIFSFTHGVSFEIILVDNASTDGSAIFFQQDNRIKFIASPTNLGFGKANNLGAKEAIGKYLFLLNSDCYLLNNAIKLFYDYTIINSFNGVLGAYLLDQNCRNIHSDGDFPYIGTILKDNLTNCLRIWFSPLQHYSFHNKQSKNYLDVRPVSYITGADMFLSKALFESFNGFDPIFFMYYEETDLQYRMHKMGIERSIIPGPRIVHLGSGSINDSLFKFELYHTSQYLFIKKHNARWRYRIFLFVNWLLMSVCVLGEPIPMALKKTKLRLLTIIGRK